VYACQQERGIPKRRRGDLVQIADPGPAPAASIPIRAIRVLGNVVQMVVWAVGGVEGGVDGST